MSLRDRSGPRRGKPHGVSARKRKSEAQDHQGSEARLDGLARQILSLRRRPLLVLFYYEYAGRISEDDVEDIYEEFRRRNWGTERPAEKLDILIHCYGGDADASYRVAQVIRNFVSDDVAFLVPFHATSGATLIALCGNRIRLGPYAVLGPIDIEFSGVELASIDSFKDFAVKARGEVENVLDETSSKRSTKVESVLLRELVKQETALNIGRLVRESSLTGHYSYRLMSDYMFRNNPNREALAQSNATELLHTFPSHHFALEYHMGTTYCKLPLEEMKENEFDKLKSLVESLKGLTEDGIICPDIGIDERDETIKAPFIRLYPR